ncbi:unnamed protein product [Choristocarpus tenellus]
MAQKRHSRPEQHAPVMAMPESSASTAQCKEMLHNNPVPTVAEADPDLKTTAGDHDDEVRPRAEKGRAMGRQDQLPQDAGAAMTEEGASLAIALAPKPKASGPDQHRNWTEAGLGVNTSTTAGVPGPECGRDQAAAEPRRPNITHTFFAHPVVLPPTWSTLDARLMYINSCLLNLGLHSGPSGQWHPESFVASSRGTWGASRDSGIPGVGLGRGAGSGKIVYLCLLAALQALCEEWGSVRTRLVSSGMNDAILPTLHPSVAKDIGSHCIVKGLQRIIMRQALDPLTVCAQAMPPWVRALTETFPGLFSLEARLTLMRRTAFGMARAVTHVQDAAKKVEEADNTSSSGREGSESRGVGDGQGADGLTHRHVLFEGSPRQEVAVPLSDYLSQLGRLGRLTVLLSRDAILDMAEFLFTLLVKGDPTAVRSADPRTSLPTQRSGSPPAPVLTRSDRPGDESQSSSGAGTRDDVGTSAGAGRSRSFAGAREGTRRQDSC